VAAAAVPGALWAAVAPADRGDGYAGAVRTAAAEAPEKYRFAVTLIGAQIVDSHSDAGVHLPGCDDVRVKDGRRSVRLTFDRAESSFAAAVERTLTTLERELPNSSVLRVERLLSGSARSTTLRWQLAFAPVQRFLKWFDVGPFVITGALFVFLGIKVLFVSRGDLTTAVGLLHTAGPAAVVVGGLLSAFPLVIALLLVVTTAWLSQQLMRRWRATRSGSHEPGFIRGPLLSVIASFTLILMAACYLTPWPTMAFSVVIGVMWTVATELLQRSGGKLFLAYVFRLLGAIYGVLITASLLCAVWLPHEALVVDGRPVVGYVLDTSDGWTSVLLSRSRELVKYRSDAISSRTLCHVSPQAAPRLPLLPSAGSETAWQWLVRPHEFGISGHTFDLYIPSTTGECSYAPPSTDGMPRGQPSRR
jgi:hypothetical protein